jgi:D-glycero-D-manno-heptose 1,7-bisphosphate phosphatase
LATLKKTIAIDSSWTLFLDRDGVINRRLKDDYVKNWSEFQFMEGVLEVMPELAAAFGRIIVVTNQQGIGKGLMSRESLDAIHEKMKEAVEAVGGRIDLILFCPDLSSQKPNCRKPHPDMGHWAKEQYPEIAFKKSIMVGDSITDIQFGENLGMTTVWVRGKEDEYHRLRKLEGRIRIDYRLNTLAQLTQILSR